MNRMAQSAEHENLMSAIRTQKVEANNRGYLQGLLAANIAVAEVTGKIKISDITDQTWTIVNEIQEKLLAAAAAEAERLEG